MKTKTRLQQIEKVLKAIDLPILVIEVKEYNTKWLPRDYPELKKMLEIEKQQIINNIEVAL